MLLNSTRADLSDLVANSGLFDADWYTRTYKDVMPSGLQAEVHYARYGQWMHRGTSKKYPNPTPRLLETLRRSPKISYCIPVMNRGDDIRSSLRFNLDANASLKNAIEFVVIFFDDDKDTHNWIKSEFSSEIQDGYLRIIFSKAITSWHFGRAKNAFRPFIKGEIYSSLDGDNYVTLEETVQLLQVGEKFGNAFVFHQFSGNWGDGTSGRVSVSNYLYQSVGYDDRFLPRQFDEIDLIITTLIKHPSTAFVRYDTKDDLFGSKRTQLFIQSRPRLPPTTYIVPHPGRRSAENPRGGDYIEGNLEYRAMLRFNQAFCFWKNASPEERQASMNEVVAARRQIVDDLPIQKLIPAVIVPVNEADRRLEVKDSELCLFTCVKNDEAFLPVLYKHYKKLGIKHFFIVDDGSTLPVAQVLPHKDVHVFQPAVGTFATAKGMWLGALIRRYLKPGMWSLTVDADEFLDLPSGDKRLQDTIARAEKAQEHVIPAILLDLIPGKVLKPEHLNFEQLMNSFTDHALASGDVAPAYQGHSSIRWGFGRFSAISWALDTRYHAFGTFDSLRKVPLTKYREKQHLNQGFHDLHFTDKSPSLGDSIWGFSNILPMRHYKMLKLYENDLFNRAQAAGKGAEYHARTSENISKIFGASQSASIQALQSIQRSKYSPAKFQKHISALRTKLISP